MSLESLKQEVYEANMELVEKRLVISTWGNVSGYDEESGLMVIKPSGVPYSELRPDQMVTVDLEGNVVDSDYVPSTDTDTHIELYKAFKDKGIKGITLVIKLEKIEIQEKEQEIEITVGAGEKLGKLARNMS